MGEFLLPFKGRNHSTLVNCNFLWNQEETYVMDNHRLAMWCWLRHLDAEPVNLLHVDRHFDAAHGDKDVARLAQVDPAAMSLDHYLDEGMDTEYFTRVPLFRWDNYLNLFIVRYASRIRQWFCATHDQGERPRGVEIWDCHPWHFPGGPVFRTPGRFVVNVDLDYFFLKGADGVRERFVSEHYLREFFAPIRLLRDEGRLACLTLCLSPECCGGWDRAEEACALACDELRLGFSLPAEPGEKTGA